MPRDPDLIVDRGRERAHLQALLDRGSPQLVLMYGRRRVGKTYLLNRVWPTERSFYFTAAETTPSQNREALLAAFAEWSGQEVRVEDYSTWRTVFRLLMEHASPDPLTITIDEFQYLGESEKDLVGVASELNAVWEMRRAPRPLVFVVGHGEDFHALGGGAVGQDQGVLAQCRAHLAHGVAAVGPDESSDTHQLLPPIRLVTRSMRSSGISASDITTR